MAFGPSGERVQPKQQEALCPNSTKERSRFPSSRRALAEIPGPKKLAIVPGATHRFEEPGTLQAAARLAKDWFLQNLFRAKGRTQTA
jgi:hypothetical protein